MSNTERTFIAIKPDGVQRGLVGDIIKRFEQRGFRLVAMKMIQVWEHCLFSGASSRFQQHLTANLDFETLNNFLGWIAGI